MRIVIAGLAKSGTTGLFYKLKNSLQGNVSAHFECHMAPEVSGGNRDHTLVKFIHRGDSEQVASFQSYEKKIAIVRDPRDRLVSAVLYSIGAHCEYADDSTKVQHMVETLRLKESGGQVDLLEILNIHRTNLGQEPLRSGVGAGSVDTLETSLLSDLSGYEVFSYDDLVCDMFATLEAYLGFKLVGSSNVDASHNRVVRTKRSGSWRHWFTPRDVAFFRPQIDSVLKLMGWDQSWDLAVPSEINPSHGSEYYLRLVQETQGRLAEKQSILDSPDFQSEKAEALAKIMGPGWLKKHDRDRG